MRAITKKEAKQRGCQYCKHITRCKTVIREEDDVGKTLSGKGCPYNTCPYTDMDKYATYDEYCENLSKKFAEVFGLFDRVSA